MRQRNVRHNTQEEDQEGTSTERRYQEGLEGSNAPSKPEQPDLISPSNADIAPPHIVAKMQIMRERMDLMMNALRGQVSSDFNDLVRRTDSLFTISVNSFPLPPKFRMSQVENYDGNKDPLDHLESFKTLIHLQGIPDEIMCKAFLTTLKGLVRIWFSRLMPNSISSFKELSAQFASHFIGGHRCWKIWFCIPYKTHSGSNIHGSISFMINNTHYVNIKI